MRTHTITDNSGEILELRASDEGQYALVHKNKSFGDTYTTTIIMNQEEVLIKLHNAIHEERR